ncbi:hypothetical protein [Methylocapsa palsarum]|uniref:Uncharacterized protein n=1 Tax=Methylocapsa palsarum TaxID=1612308 RepID=A0A1I3YAL0_9HYPH|nr:hypothetical protein [Methylocapsa palsarum]SFK28813.1 hypothetical protein SAMN05444581_105123 [Methylocapsa palsarum]
MTTLIDEARAILVDLNEKLEAARKKAAGIDVEIVGVSFAAHCDDAGARKTLDALNSKASAASLEIRSIEVAVSEAKRRVDLATTAEAAESEREKARQALALLDDFAKRGDQLQQALDKFIAKYSELTNDFRRLELLGYAPTSYALVKTNMQSAMKAALMPTDLRIEHLPPHARRDFRDVIEGWSRHVRMRASARLNKSTKAA